MPPLAEGLKAKLAAGLRARQLEHKKLHEQTNKKKQNKPTNTHRQNKQKQEKKTSKKTPTPLPSSQNLKICIVQMRGVSLSDTATNTEETLKKCLAIHKKLPQNQAEGKKYLKRMHKKKPPLPLCYLCLYISPLICQGICSKLCISHQIT